MKVDLAEKPYVSLQGEGRYVGLPMLFVRTQGCPVGCVWCDSMYTWKPHKDGGVEPIDNRCSMEVNELADLILGYDQNNVWLTGGEPMMQHRALNELITYPTDGYGRQLRHEKNFFLCTAGVTMDYEFWTNCGHVCVDVKAPSAKSLKVSEKVIDWANMNADKAEFKMVVTPSIQDREFAKIFAEDYLYSDVLLTLQPAYANEQEVRAGSLSNERTWSIGDFAKWMIDTFEDHANVAMGLQMHKEIWPTQARGI